MVKEIKFIGQKYNTCEAFSNVLLILDDNTRTKLINQLLSTDKNQNNYAITFLSDLNKTLNTYIETNNIQANQEGNYVLNDTQLSKVLSQLGINRKVTDADRVYIRNDITNRMGSFVITPSTNNEPENSINVLGSNNSLTDNNKKGNPTAFANFAWEKLEASNLALVMHAHTTSFFKTTNNKLMHINSCGTVTICDNEQEAIKYLKNQVGNTDKEITYTLFHKLFTPISTMVDLNIAEKNTENKIITNNDISKKEEKKEENKPKNETIINSQKELVLPSCDMTKQIKKCLYTMSEIQFAVKADLINLGIEQKHPLMYDADGLKQQEEKRINQAKANNPENKTTNWAQEDSVKKAIEFDKKNKRGECAILLQDGSLYSKNNKTFSIITISLENSLNEMFYNVVLPKTLGQIKDWQDTKKPKLKHHTILFPCNTGGHWVTVAIELSFNDYQQLTSTQIKVYNSLRTCGNESTILNTESIQNCIKSAFNLTVAPPTSKIEHIKSKQQIGGTDCGPITAHNIINLINGESVGTFSDKKYPEGAFDLRLEQINSIVSNNVYPDFYKSELITNYSTNQEQWDTYAQNLRKQKSKKQSTGNNASSKIETKIEKKEEKTKVDSIYTIDKDGKLTLNEKNLNKETAEKLVAELEKQPEQLKIINTIDLRNCKIDYEAARIIYECWYNKIAVTKNNDGSVTLHSEKTLNINPTLDTIQARSEELIKQQDKNGTSTFQDEIIQLTNDSLQISENIHDDPSKDTLPSTAKQSNTANVSPTSTTSTNNDNKNITNMRQQQLTQQPSNSTNIPPTTQPTNNGTTSTLPNKELASYIQQSLELQILISESLKTAFDRKLAIRNQELKKQKLAAIALGKLYQDFAEQYADEKNAKKDLNNFVETYFNDPQHHDEDVKAVNAAVRSLALLRALESSEKLTSYGFTVDFDKDKSGDYALKVSENGKALWTVTEASKPNKRIIPTQSITTLDPDFLRTFYDLKGDKNSTSDEKREKYLTAYILRKGNVTSKLNDYQDISAQNDKACYFIKELIKFYDKNKDKKEIADSGFQIDKESRKSWDKHIYLPKSNRLLSLFKRAPLTQPGEHLIEAPTVTVA